MTDWRDELLAGFDWAAPAGGGRNPTGWPGYRSRPAVRRGTGTVGGRAVVACVFDFAVYGGSFGEQEAAAFAAACADAAARSLPLVSFVRSGGTRLQEGMAALVGIPRATLALRALVAAGLAHVAVVDRPTTGGLWVTVANADLRIGVEGAVVGFSGPRVVAALTGEPPPPHAHTVAAAAEAGLVDAVVAPRADAVAAMLGRALSALAPAAAPGPMPDLPLAEPPTRTGREQVTAARSADRPDGITLLGDVLTDPVPLGAADGTVAAAAGRDATGRPAVAVALAARRGGMPSVTGYALLTRAARLADRLGARLVTLVDTPGADPRPASEAAGIASAIATALGAVLDCRPPTVSVVHGEGGSGGALAAAVTDTVLVAPYGWFAPLSPDGAAAALRRDPADVADLMGITPRDLLATGFADAAVPGAGPGLAAAVAAALNRGAAMPMEERLAARTRRWSGPLPGSVVTKR